MLGRTLGNYSIERELGRGGMGVVYAGTHGMLRRTAAIKVLLPKFSLDQEIVERFFNEARAAAAIKHPGIVEIYDFGFTDGSAYIVMELCEGESLAQRMRRRRAMPLVTALKLAKQIAGTLAAAHRAGIVHRDLKPDNVFVVPDPEVPGGERIKLLDFGIAKLAGESAGPSKTTTGVIMGTPHYMSPEQCRGAGQVDQRSDLYSLGCMLFELACGRLPFVGEGSGDIIGAHLLLPPPAPTSIVPAIPPEVERVILRLLAKKPDDRFPTADALSEELTEVIAVVPATIETRSRHPDSIAPTVPSDEAVTPISPHAQTRADSPHPEDLTDRQSDPPTARREAVLDNDPERKAQSSLTRAPTTPRREPAGESSAKQPSKRGRNIGIAGAVVAGGIAVIGIKSFTSATDTANNTLVAPGGTGTGSVFGKGETGSGDRARPGSDRWRDTLSGSGSSGSGDPWGDNKPGPGSGSGSGSGDDWSGRGFLVDALKLAPADSTYEKAARNVWNAREIERSNCYERALGSDRKPGIVLTEIAINGNGDVATQLVVGPSAPIVECIRAATLKLAFPPSTPRPSVVRFTTQLGDPSTNDDQLYEEIERETLPELTNCYFLRLTQKPALDHLNLEMTINSAGEPVAQKALMLSPRGDREVERCVIPALQDRSYRAPRSGTEVKVAFTFEFVVPRTAE